MMGEGMGRERGSDGWQKKVAEAKVSAKRAEKRRGEAKRNVKKEKEKSNEAYGNQTAVLDRSRLVRLSRH